MGFLFSGAARGSTLADVGVRPRGRSKSQHVGRSESLNSSVKWACLRLRSDLISTTPVDVYRTIDGVQVSAPTPPVLQFPDGQVDVSEWFYASQFDLDDCGNTFGAVESRDRLGYPTRIHLLDSSRVVVRVVGGKVEYRYGGDVLPADEVWHERQFPVSGSPVGLSPTAYAALSLSGYLSAAEFAATWFAGQAIPAAHLRNSEKRLNMPEAQEVKAKFTETVANGDVFVTGADWEYNVLGAKASESAFIDMLKMSAPDMCRFYGVPGDVVDVETASKSITYANVTQRNLQLLILNLGPAFVRRERAFTNGLLPRGQVVKFNTDAILRMDPAARIQQMSAEIDARLMTVTEGRGLLDRMPLTPEQEAEFARLFPKNAAVPTGVNL